MSFLSGTTNRRNRSEQHSQVAIQKHWALTGWCLEAVLERWWVDCQSPHLRITNFGRTAFFGHFALNTCLRKSPFATVVRQWLICFLPHARLAPVGDPDLAEWIACSWTKLVHDGSVATDQKDLKTNTCSKMDVSIMSPWWVSDSKGHSAKNLVSFVNMTHADLHVILCCGMKRKDSIEVFVSDNWSSFGIVLSKKGLLVCFSMWLAGDVCCSSNKNACSFCAVQWISKRKHHSELLKKWTVCHMTSQCLKQQMTDKSIRATVNVVDQHAMRLVIEKVDVSCATGDETFLKKKKCHFLPFLLFSCSEQCFLCTPILHLKNPFCHSFSVLGLTQNWQKKKVKHRWQLCLFHLFLAKELLTAATSWLLNTAWGDWCPGVSFKHQSRVWKANTN